MSARSIYMNIRGVISAAAFLPKINERLLRIEKLLTNSLKTPAAQSPALPPMRFSAIPDYKGYCPICEIGKIEWVAAYPSNNPMFRSAIVLFCSECGSGYVPSADDLIAGYYQKEYASKNRKDRSISPEEYFHGEPLPSLRKYFARARHQVEALTSHGAQFNRVLDYGSGPGYLLYLSNAKDKYAVEIDQESEKYLSYIRATKLEPDKLPNDFFDVIVASHVIEHLTSNSLRATIKAMLRSLKSTGLLLIEVPHGGHTFTNLTARQDPHTLFFTPEGIRLAVSKAGGSIAAEYCRASSEGGFPSHQVYFPRGDDTFASSRRGGITLIVGK